MTDVLLGVFDSRPSIATTIGRSADETASGSRLSWRFVVILIVGFAWWRN